MSRDAAIYLWIVASFAGLTTVHVALAVGLLSRGPRWRAAVALLVPPLAPYWGLVHGLRLRAALWGAALGSYAAALIAAYAGG